MCFLYCFLSFAEATQASSAPCARPTDWAPMVGRLRSSASMEARNPLAGPRKAIATLLPIRVMSAKWRGGKVHVHDTSVGYSEPQEFVGRGGGCDRRSHFKCDGAISIGKNLCPSPWCLARRLVLASSCRSVAAAGPQGRCAN